MLRPRNKSHAVSKDPRLAVLGGPGSGKTTLVRALRRALEAEGLTVSPGADYQDFSRRVPDGGWPEKTAIRDSHAFVALKARTPEGRELRIEFPDPAGELLLTHEGQQIEGTALHARWEAGRHQVLTHLANSTGLLMLVDPQRPPQTLLRDMEDCIGNLTRHIESRGLASRLRDGKIVARFAVLLTKADELPWQAFWRRRQADDWIDTRSELRPLADLARASFTDCRFFFSSSIGWVNGRANSRTIVRPRRIDRRTLENGNASQSQLLGELIPDPCTTAEVQAEAAESLGQRDLRPTLPLFTDPLRIVLEEDVDLKSVDQDLTGVITLPGARTPAGEASAGYRPWNVAEPVLWAAGLEHLALDG